MTIGSSACRSSAAPTAAKSDGWTMRVVPSVARSLSPPSTLSTVAATIVVSARRMPIGSGAVNVATSPAGMDTS